MHPNTIDIRKRFIEIKRANFASTEIGDFQLIYQLSKEPCIASLETCICIHERKNPYFFFTLPAKKRKNLGFKQGDILLLKIKFKDKLAMDVQKILEWGKIQISIPLARDFFKFQKEDKITIEILKKSATLPSLSSESSFDVTRFFSDKTQFIDRSEGFITIWQPLRRSLTIPRLIKRDGELFENLYLIWGDGCTTHGKTYFSNKCTDLHCKILAFFNKYLSISKDFWRLRILFKDYSKEDEHIIDYWLKSLSLKDKQLYPTISDSVLNTSNKGNARIVLESSMLTELIDNMLQYINSNLDKFSIKEQIHILNGLLMAEGSAEQSKNRYGLHYISISFSKEEKDLFEKILKNLGLNGCYITCKNQSFKFGGWKKQYALLKLFALNDVKIMNSHPERLRKILSFLENSYVKSLNSYLSVLGDGKLTAPELTSKLNYDKSSVYSYVKKYSNFINIQEIDLFTHKYLLNVSKEGKNFINTIHYLNQLKEVKNE